MRLTVSIVLSFIVLFLFNSLSYGQAVEGYLGDKRAGVDIMWFKYFGNRKKEKTPLLFFSRNRASVDYHSSPSLSGSTNAVSFNFKNGIGVVAVGSFVNSGFTPKAGVQYYRQKGRFMFFGWLVTDMNKNGKVDLFGLFRYQPTINASLRAFTQLEIFPVYSPATKIWNLTQRARVGLQFDRMVIGWMGDFNQTGKSDLATAENTGCFLRYEF